MTNDLENEFHQAMLDIYTEAAKLGYRAIFFLGMVHEHGGVDTAKRLLSTTSEQYGFAKLWELGRLT